jgi:hypothetical protein
LKGALQMESVAATLPGAEPQTSNASEMLPHLGARASVTFPKRSLKVD